MSVKTIIQEAINKSPVSLKEALEEELRTRVALALEAKMKDDEEDEDEDDDSDEDEDDEKCESVEQIDEISNKTLNSYLHRSTTRDNSIGSLKKKSRAHKTLGDEEEADRLMKKAKTREKYFSKALARRDVQAGELKKDGSIHRNGTVYQLDKKSPLMKDLKKVPSPYFKEEAEQIDEISNKTLDSYLHRSTTRLPKDGDNSIGSLKKKSRAHKTLGDEGEADRLMKKAKTREKYFSKALARRDVQAGELKKDGSIHRNGSVYQLDKKSPLMKDLKKVPSPYFKESFDLSDYTVEELEDFMMSEEFEQLDEISKNTLDSYIKKAGRSANKSFSNAIKQQSIANRTGSESADKKRAQHSKDFDKRATGIDRAKARLSKD